MKKYDVIIIGAGSGLTISSQAAAQGLKVAVIEESDFGGVCLNRGCIPSKMLIHAADVAETIQRSEEWGIKADIKNIDWNKIQKWVWGEIKPDAASIEKGNRSNKNITVYKTHGKFVGKKQIRVGKEVITADKIFICAGSRPRIPAIPGLDEVPYHTSDDVMELKKQPKSMIVVGGGYIATELGHFFASLGTKVTIINRSNFLVRHEDEEVSAAYTKIAAKKFNLILNTEICNAEKRGKNIELVIQDKTGRQRKISAEELLVATGRVPNTDLLDVEKTGVALTKEGFVKINAYTETNVPGIWAIGDIAGIFMLKHSANLEAEYCAHNAFNPKEKIKIDYHAMPHAIFSSPQIAGVGATEQELKAKKANYRVGRYKYYNTAMGKAIEDKEGFTKVLVDPKGKILGCHIIGHDASSIIHEVIVAMKHDLGVDGILEAVHIHPALPEVVQRAFGAIEWKS